jgi:hypothetical protein
MTSWHLDMFHDFLTLFTFYIIKKQLDRIFADMFREYILWIFWPVIVYDLNL